MARSNEELEALRINACRELARIVALLKCGKEDRALKANDELRSLVRMMFD